MKDARIPHVITDRDMRERQTFINSLPAVANTPEPEGWDWDAYERFDESQHAAEVLDPEQALIRAEDGGL